MDFKISGSHPQSIGLIWTNPLLPCHNWPRYPWAPLHPYHGEDWKCSCELWSLDLWNEIDHLCVDHQVGLSKSDQLSLGNLELPSWYILGECRQNCSEDIQIVDATCCYNQLCLDMFGSFHITWQSLTTWSSCLYCGLDQEQGLSAPEHAAAPPLF